MKQILKTAAIAVVAVYGVNIILGAFGPTAAFKTQVNAGNILPFTIG